MIKTLKRVLRRIVYGPTEIEKRDLMAVYASVFSGSAGDIVLEDLCKKFHIFGSTFSPGDPHESTLKEGERNAVLYIITMMSGDK